MMYVNDKIDYIRDNHYYVVDGYKTPNKNMALLLAGGNTDKIHFYNMEHVWDAVDWTVEPPESIDKLSETRCKQLRYQYDWLCLWYTSGYDSQTVLESCIRAGVKIDEIAMYVRPSYYKDPETAVARKEIENYKKYHNPKVKVLEVVVGLEYHKEAYKRMGEDWLLSMPAQNLRFSKTTAMFLHNFHDDLKKHKEATKGRRADIYGYEKPRVDFRDGVWYAQSLDIIYRDFMGANIECFFTTAAMPELHVKQHHLMIKWLETIPDMSHDKVHTIQSFTTHTKSWDDLKKMEAKDRPIAPLYKEWNVAMGRSMAKTFEGQHALNKLDFQQVISAKETRKMLRHLVNTDDKILNYAHKTRLELSKSLNNLTNFSIPVLGKSWKIRSYTDRTQETPKILV